MQGGAPRLLSRLCRGIARGAGLAAGVCLAGAAAADVVAADYADPTTRYAHAVLGDAIEYGTLRMTGRDGRTRRVVLPLERVFEDLAPRLADVTGDGASEVIAVESHRDLGARLVIYGLEGVLAATPYIGRSNRWLAPVGAGDLDGDGRIEVAYVDRPHLARVLRLWRLVPEGAGWRLVEVAAREGLTNHRIGRDVIPGGLRDCGNGLELVTADAGWTRIMVSTFDGVRLSSRAIAERPTEARLARAVACQL